MTSRGLPDGLTLVTGFTLAGEAMVQQAAADLIVGYTVPTESFYRDRAKKLELLFSGGQSPPRPSRTIGVIDPTGQRIFGAAIIEAQPGVEMADEDRARDLATFHYVLAALFVFPSAVGRESAWLSWTRPAGKR